MREPERAERLWLVMAVAYLWVVSMGTHVLETPSHLARLSRVKGNRLGVFKLGLHSLDRWMGSRRTDSPTKANTRPRVPHRKKCPFNKPLMGEGIIHPSLSLL